MGCFVLCLESISPRVAPRLLREAGEVMLGCSDSLPGPGAASACRKLSLLAAGALSGDDFLHPSLQLCYRGWDWKQSRARTERSSLQDSLPAWVNAKGGIWCWRPQSKHSQNCIFAADASLYGDRSSLQVPTNNSHLKSKPGVLINLGHH